MVRLLFYMERTTHIPSQSLLAVINYIKAEQSFVICVVARYSYPKLTAAHIALDKAVDKAYGYKGKGDDASRVEFLLKRIADSA